MVNLAVLNIPKPAQILQEGILAGDSLDLQLSGVAEHVHSRAATIYRVPSKSGQIALKVVFAPDVREPHDVRKEIRLLSRLVHPNICVLLNAYFIESHYVLALPFYSLTLQDILDDPTFVPLHHENTFTSTAKHLIKQMCSAVSSLESQHVAHRDLSPSNFLISAEGHLVLTDFGVAYDAGNPGQEGTGNLQFELGTGPYRAPELLFGSRSYDPFAIDRWALGAIIAGLFTAVGPTRPPSPDSDEPQLFFLSTTTSGPIIRSSLFEGGYSDFALIGSIFKIRGTPTVETWPDAKNLPDFGKFTYRQFPPADLKTLLPNIPNHEHGANDIIELIGGFLMFPAAERLKASAALQHTWLKHGNVPHSLPSDALKWFIR